MRNAKWPTLILLFALLVVPRVVALDADTLPSLCWNSGIWTDEGFYTYNARNAVLFGRPELDEFNNRVLSPVLDIVQRAVFATFGVGLVQARAVSVVCSLLALAFFYDALRRVFGRRIALTGLLLLGCEVTFILYNRLALMETPGVLVLCAALWGVSLNRPAGWLLAGALAAGALAFKTTLLVFLPVPLLVLAWRAWEERRRGGAVRRDTAAWYVAGAALGFALYLGLWGIPHRAEILRMNNYYRTRQIQPRSVAQAARYGERALMGYKRGLMQYLETRTPVLASLLVVGLTMAPLGAAGTRRAGRRRDFLRTLWLWAGLSLLALAVSRYSPSRYYLVAYPAIAGLAAVTLWRIAPLWRWARRKRGAWPLLMAGAPGFLLVYHLLLPALYALRRAEAGPALDGVLDRVGAHFGLSAYILAGTITALALWKLAARLPSLPRPRRLVGGALAAFLAISLAQWGNWYVHRGYETRAAAAALERIVGPDAVLAGDWAPNLCLNNDVRAVPVLPGLANWQNPVGLLDADYVLVTQTPWPMRYWRLQAPKVVHRENLVDSIDIHGYRLNVYRVPDAVRDEAARRPSARPTQPVRQG